MMAKTTWIKFQFSIEKFWITNERITKIITFSMFLFLEDKKQNENHKNLLGNLFKLDSSCLNYYQGDDYWNRRRWKLGIWCKLFPCCVIQFKIHRFDGLQEMFQSFYGGLLWLHSKKKFKEGSELLSLCENM